jgi:hypothetical protein
MGENRMTSSELETNLAHFSGSETFTRYSILSKSMLTAGARYLADKGQCYWLFDAIQSHLDQHNEDYVQSTLIVQKDSTATLELDDMDNNIIANQLLTYTTFPLTKIKIWSVKNQWGSYTHMLPSEY